MYIRRVVIKGFKTYRNETVIDNFSPHHNIVVGSNGSGKSNFFAAIRFVLSDDYANLKREERQGLIHQGSGFVMSASVEIVFHDPEHRMLLPSGVAPSNSDDEVYVRRTVGLKKDDYQLNDRNVTKGDIVRMLESAGFSMSNPYNIVPQGKIISLTNAKDKERLQLLEDVVGAKSFDIKLRASLKKMEETEQKRLQIAKEMKDLNKKLDELEEERSELEKYNSLENKRKALQFTLYDRELNDIINQIEKIDAEFNSSLISSEEYLQELDKRESMITDVTERLQSIENDLKLKVSTEMQQAKAKNLELANTYADYKVKLNDIESSLKLQSEQFRQDKELLSMTEKSIDQKESQLLDILPTFEKLTKDESSQKFTLAQHKQKQRDLMLKKGKYSNFKNKEERDSWIKSEINTLNADLENLNIQLLQHIESHNDINSNIKSHDENIEELLDSVQGPSITAEISECTDSLRQLKEKYSSKFDERKELWRSEQKLQTILENVREDVKKSEGHVNETMNRSLAHGIASVKEITEKLSLSGDQVFGTLGELIKVSDKYKRCAEIIGGNSLFNIVVDTDETASLIMDELYHMKGGRVTFMPLNRIFSDPNVTYPPNEQASCTPLIKKIKYDAKFEKAVKHIFARTIVVKDLGQGAKIARKFRLNAITLDGDRVDKKGVLTGGYYDQHKRTKLESLKDLKKMRNHHTLITNELKDVKTKLQDLDFEIDEINSNMRKATSQKESLLSTVETLNIKLNKERTEKISLEERQKIVAQKEEKTSSSVKTLQEKIAQFEVEIKSPFDNELSPAEKEELENVSAKITENQSKLELIENELDKLTTTIDALNAELESKLIPQKKDLLKKLAEGNEVSHTGAEDKIKLLSIEKSSIESQLAASKDEVDTLQSSIDSLNSEKEKNQKILDKANSQQRVLLKKLDSYQQGSEKFMIKKATLSHRRDELQQKVRELGLLAEDILVDHQNETSEELVQLLNLTINEVSSLNNVNKRAFENFKRFDEKKIELVERAKELDDSKDSIQELITKLKEQKVSAVDTTFKKVAENFSTIFEKLIPRGAANLIIHQKKNSENEDDMEVDEELIYTGVSISVSFNSKNNEQLHVEQLSGGQKTVCAIALILAIQMVDPAPFYLFDEVDAALDKQYRTAVAEIIKSLSANAQFICTTFRSDMLEVADKFFRVKYENKISTVIEVDRKSAIKFVKGSAQSNDV